MYPKLVRDKIPSIIMNDNKTVIYRKAVSDKEYIEYLNKKLLEEVNEYLENNDVNELIDILEVIYSIAEINNISKEDLEKDRQYKESTRGSFNDRYIIEDVKGF